MESTCESSSSVDSLHSGSKQNLEKIKQCHDEAYLYVEQALNLDETGHADQAIILYKKSLACMDVAFTIPHHGPQYTGQEWQKARNLIQKMKHFRPQIQSRLESCTQTADSSPPSYEEATGSAVTSINRALEDICNDDNLDSLDASMAAATELFRIDSGVQIFFIKRDGYVSAPSYPSSLGVYRFVDSVMTGGTTSADVELLQVFLRIGDWTYPLLEGQSPVLHAKWGAYIFPDVLSSEGDAVGVIIPDYVSPTERAKFERLMNEYTSVKNQAVTPSGNEQRFFDGEPVLPPGSPTYVRSLSEERTSSKISRGIETAAEWVSWGIMNGAKKTGQLLKKGAVKLRENIEPEHRSVSVDHRAQQGLYYTRKATEGAVMVSAFVVEKLGQGTMYLARKAAPHLREHGEKYLPRCVVQKEADGQSKLDGALEVAAGGIKGWVTVYTGLEQAAKVLAKNIADETVHVVTHKYGQEVGQVTEDTLYAGGNIAMTFHYTSGIGTKAIAKRVAKETGKAIAEETTIQKQCRVGHDDVEQGTMDCGDKSTELRDN